MSTSSRAGSWVSRVAVGLVTAACASDEPVGSSYVCTADVKPAIVVEIMDLTGAPLADNARGAVHDGTYVDSLTPYGFLGGRLPTPMRSRRAADERRGRYRVEVRHPGYQTWVATDIVVTAGPCHVQTRTLTARLAPMSH